MLKRWFTEQIKATFLITLLILANLLCSFLIWACYIVFTGFAQWLKQEYPNALVGLTNNIVEGLLQWSTIILIAALLFKSLLSVIKQPIPFGKVGDEPDANKNEPKTGS